MSKRTLLYPLAAILIVGAWLMVVYLPGLQVNSRLEAAAAEANWQLDDFNGIMKQLPKYLLAHKDLTFQRERLTSSLYAKEDILQLFEQLGVAAASHNLDLVEINPPVDELLALNRTDPRSNDPQFLNVTLGLRGTYPDFGRFVTTLEEQAFFRDINSFYVRGSQTPQPSVECRISFRALIKLAGETTS